MSKTICLKKSKNKRKTCLTEIAILLSLGTRAKKDCTLVNLFKVRCVELDSLKDEFLKHHHNIITAILTENADADLEPENIIREGFLADFYETKAIYIELFEPEPSDGTSQSFNASVTGHAHSRCQRQITKT